MVICKTPNPPFSGFASLPSDLYPDGCRRRDENGDPRSLHALRRHGHHRRGAAGATAVASGGASISGRFSAAVAAACQRSRSCRASASCSSRCRTRAWSSSTAGTGGVALWPIASPLGQCGSVPAGARSRSGSKTRNSSEGSTVMRPSSWRVAESFPAATARLNVLLLTPTSLAACRRESCM